jgi:hypothetical protein
MPTRSGPFYGNVATTAGRYDELGAAQGATARARVVLGNSFAAPRRDPYRQARAEG